MRNIQSSIAGFEDRGSMCKDDLRARKKEETSGQSQQGNRLTDFNPTTANNLILIIS